MSIHDISIRVILIEGEETSFHEKSARTGLDFEYLILSKVWPEDDVQKPL